MQQTKLLTLLKRRLLTPLMLQPMPLTKLLMLLKKPPLTPLTL